MANINKQMALDYHEDGRPGKIEVVPTKPYASQKDLSLAYSPGVAYPCEEIEAHPSDVYKYTNKGNLIGVISNGTAVLGLGNIGALAGKPVMEGKALLFKIFAGLDAFDIEVNADDPELMIQTVKALEPTFGGINLEDIKAPECFEIESRLKEQLSIPVMHDDQHGTAIISGAGLLNALEIQHKNISEVKLVVNGAGAAAVSCTRLYIELGIRPENVVMCDSKGVIRKDRKNLTPSKAEFATSRDLHTLAEALVGADVFLGLSVADCVTPEMVKSMAARPIVFALANPSPEIDYDLAVNSRPDVIVATGRSDYPNQINNVIGFPYIFRGALDCRATCINEDMKIAAVKAIAELAHRPVPSVVDQAYGKRDIKFGRDYILPKALDPRLLATVAPAVAKAAMQSGVAKAPILDWNGYDDFLHRVMGEDGSLMRHLSEMAAANKSRVVFTDANSDNMLRAAVDVEMDGLADVIVIGNRAELRHRADLLGISIDNLEIIDPRLKESAEKVKLYAEILYEKRNRLGMTYSEAVSAVCDPKIFGMLMVEAADADAMLAGVVSAADRYSDMAREIIGLRRGYESYATMHILNTRSGQLFIADTGVTRKHDARSLVDITRLAAGAVRSFGVEPVAAMVSYSNFGSDSDGEEPHMIADAVRILHDNYPDISVDGEMQLNYALDKDLRQRDYPFCSLDDKKVNTLIFPNLTAANATYKMLLAQGVGSVIGPITLGLRRPVYFTSNTSSENDIVNLATIAAVNSHFFQKVGVNRSKIV